MSHVVSIQTEVRDPVAICAGCRRLGIYERLGGTGTKPGQKVRRDPSQN